MKAACVAIAVFVFAITGCSDAARTRAEADAESAREAQAKAEAELARVKAEAERARVRTGSDEVVTPSELVAPRLLAPEDGTVRSDFPRKMKVQWAPVLCRHVHGRGRIPGPGHAMASQWPAEGKRSRPNTSLNSSYAQPGRGALDGGCQRPGRPEEQLVELSLFAVNWSPRTSQVEQLLSSGLPVAPYPIAPDSGRREHGEYAHAHRESARSDPSPCTAGWRQHESIAVQLSGLSLLEHSEKAVRRLLFRA